MKRFFALALVALLSFSFACASPAAQSEPASAATPASEPEAAAPQTEEIDPNTVIEFQDDALESGIRNALNKPEGDILVSDALAVTELNLEMDGGDWSIPRIQNLDALKYFKNLTYLNLGWALQNGGRGVDLSPLSGLTQLNDLQLPCTDINDLSPLSTLVNLSFLSIWGCRTITDISALSEMKRLYSLQIHGNYISDLGPLSGLSELGVLTAQENVIQDVSALSGCTKLTTLFLSNNLISDYTPLAGMYSNLEEKDFSLEDVPQPIDFQDPVLEQKVREALGIPEGDITFLQTKDITDLQLGNPWAETIPEEIKIKEIGALKCFPNLFNLSLNFNGVSQLDVLRAMPNLGMLDLNGNPVQNIQAIASCTKLSWLNLSGCLMEDLSALAGLSELESLLLSYSPCIKDLEPLAALTSLKELRLENVLLDLTPVSGLTNLKTLYIAQDENLDLSPLAEIYPNLTDKNFEMQ